MFESKILSRIKPTEKEILDIESKANELKSIITDNIAMHGYDVKLRLVGSFAKGTFLNPTDLDIFMLFPEGTTKKTLEEIGLRTGEEILHGERLFSEHPYTRGVYKGIDVDLVPCMAISSTANIQTAVDRTPFHTDYILSVTDENSRDQIRLLKAFMKGIGTYGAEPKARGFSGYLCELLVVKYGSFSEVLKASQQWKDGVVITILKKGPAIKSAMVLYDPVDERRNVASAVHLDTMVRFMVAAKSYLTEPSEKFFFPVKRTPLSREVLKSKIAINGTKLISVKFDCPDTLEEHRYAQLWKTRYGIVKKLEEHEFKIINCVQNLSDGSMKFVFELEQDCLSETFRHSGPPVWVDRASSFLDKWNNGEYGPPFIENGCWIVRAKRQYTSPKALLENEASRLGIGREVNMNTLKILDHESTLKFIDELLLTELLDPRMPWEN